MRGEKILFSGILADDFVSKRRIGIQDEIGGLSESNILGTGIDELCDYFESKYNLDVPKLDREQTKIERIQPTKPSESQSLRIAVYVPYEGDSSLFEVQPSTSRIPHPRAQITADTLILTIVVDGGLVDRDTASINKAISNNIDNIEKDLLQLTRDFGNFNATCRSFSHDRIVERHKLIESDLGIVSSLAFPLKERAADARPLPVPIKRKRLPTLPAAKSTVLDEPTYVLEAAHYEHILSVMQNMASVMERSPRAFETIQEEDLRWHFLFQLNGHYEGQATGETFNYHGKTDILIRDKGRNIFVAECKFWRGPKSLQETIDQLLNYTSWHDTKTAIVLFNRGKDFSSVLEKIPQTVKEHPNFKKELPSKAETHFRYLFTHRDDPKRELTVTIMVFEVPSVS